MEVISKAGDKIMGLGVDGGVHFVITPPSRPAPDGSGEAVMDLFTTGLKNDTATQLLQIIEKGNGEVSTPDKSFLCTCKNKTATLSVARGDRPNSWHEIELSGRPYKDFRKLLENAMQDNDLQAALPHNTGPAVAKVKVGRNEPCPCGSGKKYKKCCWLN